MTMTATAPTRKISKPRNLTAYYRLLVYFTQGRNAGTESYFYFGWRDKHDSERARNQGFNAMKAALWSDQWMGTYSGAYIYDQIDKTKKTYIGKVSPDGTIEML